MPCTSCPTTAVPASSANSPDIMPKPETQPFGHDCTRSLNRNRSQTLLASEKKRSYHWMANKHSCSPRGFVEEGWLLVIGIGMTSDSLNRPSSDLAIARSTDCCTTLQTQRSAVFGRSGVKK